jgi:regulator of sigma E protease
MNLEGVEDTRRRLQWPPDDGGMRSLEPLRLTFEQGGKVQTARITPVDGEWGEVDFSPRLDYCRVVPAGRPVAALGQAFTEMAQWTYVGSRALWLLVTGRLPFRELSGPLMIFTASRYQVEMGFLNFVEFIAMITISLGVANLMPLPVLDGGNLVFLAVEKVRGAPISEKVMVRILYAGWVVLIGLLIAVTRNDILRLIGL